MAHPTLMARLGHAPIATRCLGLNSPPAGNAARFVPSPSYPPNTDRHPNPGFGVALIFQPVPEMFGQWWRGTRAGTDVSRDLACEGVNLSQLQPVKKSQNQSCGECIACTHRIRDLHRFRWLIRPLALLIEQAAFPATGEGYDLEVKLVR